ncbi:MAG: hypothetical protein CL920_33965 [Deltaproteobacteria bacterium]|nr:hypothetical protein [Deltaproteobacteria bacterium]MBU53729.1 hypothetical protein [Deltaproteobacteria bacterium]
MNLSRHCVQFDCNTNEQLQPPNNETTPFAKMDMPGETFTHLHLFIFTSLAHPYSIEANTCKKVHFTDMTTKA